MSVWKERRFCVTSKQANRLTGKPIRSYLKKVFSPGIGVESLSQVLDILEYACGLILGLALISNENPNVEIASINVPHFTVTAIWSAGSQKRNDARLFERIQPAKIKITCLDRRDRINRDQYEKQINLRKDN